jgi:hypothetical protein
MDFLMSSQGSNVLKTYVESFLADWDNWVYSVRISTQKGNFNLANAFDFMHLVLIVVAFVMGNVFFLILPIVAHSKSSIVIFCLLHNIIYESLVLKRISMIFSDYYTSNYLKSNYERIYASNETGSWNYTCYICDASIEGTVYKSRTCSNHFHGGCVKCNHAYLMGCKECRHKLKH